MILGVVKRVILNRPQALNALNLNMVRQLSPQYKEWMKDPKTVVIMRGSGDRAFCAGGDIRSIYDSVVESKGSQSLHRDFFSEEYRLNYDIAKKTITQVSLLNGITMGGGVGLSVHGKYRVATDNTLFAMPETGIGFFCDVGGSYFLPRLDESLGMYLALTGGRVKGADCTRVGIATHFVKHEKLAELETLLIHAKSAEEVEQILSGYKNIPEATTVPDFIEYKDLISQCFSKNSVEEIFDSLNKIATSNTHDFKTIGWAKTTLSTLEKHSPTSLKVVHRQLIEGKKLSYEEVFKMENRIAQTFMKKRKDFFEGVRALLVDKDKNPKWSPATVKEVSTQEVDEYFKKVSEADELSL